MSCRNRKDNGNPTMVAQIARHFNLPDSKASSSNLQADLFQQFIYLTQVPSCQQKDRARIPCLRHLHCIAPFLT